MDIKATSLVHNEWESLDQFSKLKGTDYLTSISAYGLADNISAIGYPGYSSAAQTYLESHPLRYVQDSIVKRAALGFDDYDLGVKSAFSLVRDGYIAQNVFDSMYYSSVIKDSLSLHKLRTIDSVNNIQKMIGSSLLDTVYKSMGLVAGLESLQESFSAKILAGLKTYEGVLGALNSRESLNVVQNASMSLLALDSMQMSAGFRASAIQQTVKTIQEMRLAEVPESISRTFDQLQSSGMFSKSIEALSRDSMFAQAMESFNALEYSGRPTYAISESELSENISLIKNSGDVNFIDTFIKLHPTTKAIIIFIFLQIFMPQFNNICSSLIMPFIEKAIGAGKLNTDQIREIKKTPLNGANSENVRFLTRNNVKLRAKPSTNSEVLDILVIGQIFEVVNKKKRWAEIVYFCDDGQLSRGWVLTTYTAKFKSR